MSVVDLPSRTAGRRRTSGAPRRRTSPPSRASSAACCCPRTRSPTSSRSSRGNDFYRPAHELVYDAILDLYGRGEPADAVTVAAELTKRGELGRVGGAAYLHTLVQSVPTAANAGYYARDRPRARRPAPPGRGRHQDRPARLRGADGQGGGDVDEIVNAAQAEIYAVTERRTSEDYLPLGDIIEGTIDEIEALRRAAATG